jgi:hypothetical protein
VADLFFRLRILFFLLALLFPCIVFAQGLDLPFTGISPEDRARLEAGEYVFRNLDSPEEISFRGTGGEADHIRSVLKEVDPNFVAEIMMVIPVDRERDNLEYIRERLLDVTLFDGIPYYSERNEKFYPLYANTKILSSEETSSGRNTVVAYHKMKPFDPQELIYHYTLNDGVFLFESRNHGHLYYKGVRAVREGNMVSLLWIRDEGENLVVYGVGGASAFTFFGLFGERLNDSFVGRVNAFFSWFHEKFLPELKFEK